MPQAKAVQQHSRNENSHGQLSEQRDFHGAAIIDDSGNEIPITEEMIQHACDELSCAWLFPRQDQKH